MKSPFEHTSASWVRYSDYEWKNNADGDWYILPAEGASPKPHDPMTDKEGLVLAAMEIGWRIFQKKPDDEIKAHIRAFACKYGLLGIMTAPPTTANFIDYEKVYFPKNDLIPVEVMETKDYLSLFYPFRMPDFKKQGIESVWNHSGDVAEQALIITYQTEPQAVVMSFMRDYGEPYEWLVSVFKDWAFTLFTTKFYYERKDTPDAETRELYERGMAAFEDNTPTYHLELRKNPPWSGISIPFC